MHYRERALELGVPPENVLVEPHAPNTGENIQLTRALLEEAGHHVESVLLVSKPYEERRAYTTARKLWPEVKGSEHVITDDLVEYVDSIRDPRPGHRHARRRSTAATALPRPGPHGASARAAPVSDGVPAPMRPGFH
ncbi:YdcF family protein [Streptomyces sp. NBC_00249]|uniref:YdcF family protein n=1 Tax=Streptomyces sp. NBC_00249 TaxID=2975690 RepID=UPI002B1E1210|nr:YdcF family protein [Streptomyces sp. NBC_00249]